MLAQLAEMCQTERGQHAARAMLAWAIIETTPLIGEVAPETNARLHDAATTGVALADVEAHVEALDDHIDDTQQFADLQRDLRALAALAPELAARCQHAVDRARAAILARALAAFAETGATMDAEARSFFTREIATMIDARWQALRATASPT